MPALVRTGQITTDEARDAVEYLESLAGRPYDEATALRGRTVYYNKGSCYDCHANDAKGIPDYMPRLFTHGFTTKAEGHGFGLHSGALAAKELGGTLEAASEGLGHGATFTLTLPLTPPGT
jgi:hypothetical protein